ncbi:MAG: hypothetical protein QOF46_18 [Paraburkholderia sp.]|nr:hypothetical protein [Paraburkholderia sp.]
MNGNEQAATQQPVTVKIDWDKQMPRGRGTGAVEMVPPQAMEHFRLSAVGSRTQDPIEMLAILDRRDAIGRALLAGGWTEEQLSANALNIAVSYFRELVQEGIYSAAYALPYPTAPEDEKLVATAIPSAAEPSRATHEEKAMMDTLKAALRPFLKPGETLIWPAPFRWHDDSGVRSNHYECQSLDELRQTFGFEIVHDFQHVAVIKERKH